MSANYDVTAHCGECGATWETWGIVWAEPADLAREFPGGDWILGRTDCPVCGESARTLVQSVNNELGKAENPSLTAGERNA